MTVTKIQIVKRLIPREIFDAIVKLDSRSQKIVNFASLLLMNVALEFIIVMKTHFALIKQTVMDVFAMMDMLAMASLVTKSNIAKLSNVTMDMPVLTVLAVLCVWILMNVNLVDYVEPIIPA